MVKHTPQQDLSWLERTPDKGEVRCSSHRWPTSSKSKLPQGFQPPPEAAFALENFQEKERWNTPSKTKVKHETGRFLSVAQAAKRLSVATLTVVRWCQSGKLTAIPKPYGQKTTYLIPPQAIQLLLSQQTEEERMPCKRAKVSIDHYLLIPEWQKAMRHGLMTGKPFSPYTVAYYSSYVETFVERHSQVSVRALADELSSMPVEQFGKRDKFYKAVICFAKFLSQEKALEPIFLKKVKQFKPKRHRPPKRHTVDDLSLDSLISSCETDMDRLIVILLSSTGLRAGECCNLKVSDIDLNKGTLWVRLAKGGKSRTVGLPHALQTELQGYLRQRSLLLSDTSLLQNSLNQQMDRHGLRQRLERIGKNEMIPKK